VRGEIRDLIPRCFGVVDLPSDERNGDVPAPVDDLSCAMLLRASPRPSDNIAAETSHPNVRQ
jgi:hypothetical protein